MHLCPIQNQNFKGYDACPIKRLYMQGVCNKGHAEVFNELKEACEKEDVSLLMYNNPGFSKEFDGKYCQTQHPWAQDDKTFVRSRGKTKILTEHCTDREIYQSMALTDFVRGLGYKKQNNKSFLAGGNIYIGKKPNGEKWILMGEDELERNLLRQVCEEYGVSINNIYPISQPNFHIDMAVRPIGYPYILVNDENIAAHNAIRQSIELSLETDEFYNDLYKQDAFSPCYVRSKQTVGELERLGFIPIRIGGVYTSGINYMNAIVNQHSDGTITYITNSTKNSKHEGLDEVFERELRAKVPNIRDVYFISGEQDNEYPKLNAIMKILSKKGGGIHCLNLEEPNFEAWG